MIFLCDFQFCQFKEIIGTKYYLSIISSNSQGIMEQVKDQTAKNFIGMNGETTGLGFVNRDTEAKKEEEKNIITFKVIKNDQTRQSMRHLLDLKNIFARQLPKMPKQYIVKLVFDRNHEAMIILKDGLKVIGGICFRIFGQEKFVEIAFLAITSTQQIRGYAQRYIRMYKEQMQKRKIEFMMTYADNLAIGYFKKQGFSKDCRSPPERWKGYIKDYEGGTMMECHIHPVIDYSRVSQIIKRQRDFVISKVKEISLNDRPYNGRDLQKLIDKEKENFQRENQAHEVDTFRINPEKIPGMIEGGWTWQDHDDLKKTKEISFQLQCSTIIDLLKKHQSVWPFRQPVSLQDVPDYYSMVKNPMDLKKIEKKLLNNEYPDRQSFCSDILLMFENCRAYNQNETIYFKCSKELEEYIKPHLEKLKESSEDLMIDAAQRHSRKTQPIKKKIEKKRH